MNYDLTEQRKAYIDARGYSILMACPGSGTTTSIVYKLNVLIPEIERLCGGVGILCLSFTNKACEEIRAKFREMHSCSIKYPHLVATIDSFVNQYIILPFWQCYCNIKQYPKIINDKEILRKCYWIDNSDKEVLNSHFSRYTNEAYIYRPEEIYITKNGYRCGKVLVNQNNNNNLLEYFQCVIRYRFSKGIITSSHALWIAIYLCKKNPQIAISLANRFKYIMIDEAQDTSELQFDLFEIIKKGGLENLEFIGDLNQSIYEWRDARPDFLHQLSCKEEWKIYNFTENRRSTQNIIDLYSRLKPKGTPNIQSYQVTDLNIPIIFYRYDELGVPNVAKAFERQCEQYCLNERLILARGTKDIERLSCKKSEVEVWKNRIPYRIIRAIIARDNNKISEAVEHYKWVIAEILHPNNISGMKVYLSEHDNPKFYSEILCSLSSMPSLENSFAEWDKQTRNFLTKQYRLEYSLDFQIKKRMAGYTMNQLLQNKVSDYFGIDNENATQAQTIHSVKGASVDAILLFLDEKKTGQGISIADIPSNIDTIKEMKEKERLIYVACSRAKQLVAIAVPQKVSEKSIKQRFGGLNISIENVSVQKNLFDS